MQLFLGNEGKEPWTKLNWICWCYANKCLSVLGWRKQPAPYTVQVTCSQLTQWKQQIQRKALHLPWIKLGGVFKENRFYFWQTSHWAEGILHGRVNTPLTLREDPYTPIQQQPYNKALNTEKQPSVPSHHLSLSTTNPHRCPAAQQASRHLFPSHHQGLPGSTPSQAGLHSHTTTAPATRAGLPTRIFVPNAIS